MFKCPGLMHSQTLLQSRCKVAVKSFQCDLRTPADLSKIRLSPLCGQDCCPRWKSEVHEVFRYVVRFSRRSNPALAGARMLSNFQKPQWYLRFCLSLTFGEVLGWQNSKSLRGGRRLSIAVHQPWLSLTPNVWRRFHAGHQCRSARLGVGGFRVRTSANAMQFDFEIFERGRSQVVWYDMHLYARFYQEVPTW